MSTLVGPFQVSARGPDKTSPIAAASAKMVKLTQQALVAVDDDVNVAAMLDKPIPVLFGYVKSIPGTHDKAAGYTVGGPGILVRFNQAGAPNLSPESVIGTILHEGLGHCYLALHGPSDDWQRRALALLTEGPAIPHFNDPDEVWTGVPGETDYWLRPYECLINDMVVALANVTVSWSHKYRRHVADLPALKALWLELIATPAPPPVVVPPDEPTSDPLPPPPDPVAALQAQLDAANQVLATIHDLSTPETS